MNNELRKALAFTPITWTGDLLDDCTAEWAGLMLRAEWMDDDYWWWAVYDMQRNEITIENSNEYDERFISGEAARSIAENAAKAYIETITRPLMAKYMIADTFKITGRGLVFAGYIIEGNVSAGDIIEFIAFETIRHRKIIGIEAILTQQPDKINTGLLIQCKNEAEIAELKSWIPGNTIAFVLKSEIKYV